MRPSRPLLLTLVAACLAGCGGEIDNPLLLPPRESDPVDTSHLMLVARIVHITDTHIVDTQSPARFAGAHGFTQSAWRAWESYSTQILDGIIRTTNRLHASGQPIDFLLHTGDACDNAQANELSWFLAVLDGGAINPLSGPDDRSDEARPPPLLDPYAAFAAQGLYRTGIHGERPSIPWYALIGNHDTFAIGVFPIVTCLLDGSRTAPLPLGRRPGILLPTVLDPTGCWAHGNVTPADSGPPNLLELPRFVAPNPQRAYFRAREFMQALADTAAGPAGHGFQDAANGPTWYSLSPVPGLRLIGLDTSDQPVTLPGLPYSEGCISETQRGFLRAELETAQGRGEIIVVASHHPSQALEPLYGSALGPSDFREMLGEYPNVVLHLAGHFHRNRVANRGSYVEIETCSTLDPPQEGRIIEMWRDGTDGSTVIRYRMFSHIDDTLPPLGDDALRDLRVQGRTIAMQAAAGAARERPIDGADADPHGSPSDRAGVIRLSR